MLCHLVKIELAHGLVEYLLLNHSLWRTATSRASCPCCYCCGLGKNPCGCWEALRFETISHLPYASIKNIFENHAQLQRLSLLAVKKMILSIFLVYLRWHLLENKWMNESLIYCSSRIVGFFIPHGNVERLETAVVLAYLKASLDLRALILGLSQGYNNMPFLSDDLISGLARLVKLAL